VLVIGGPLARADVPGLCERVRALLEDSDADPLLCDVSALVEPDAVTVDALARLQLTARRLGRRIRLRGASPELQELLSFLGLEDVLPSAGALRRGTSRQAEEREESLGVEERMELDDATG
jgi:ABC-type transporter Mla MlaB component